MIEQNHEYYIDLEVAKLLKEAGFVWETEFGQHIWDRDIRLEHNINFNSEKYLVSLPTLDVAQRWLRESKDFDINVLTDFDSVKRLYYVRYVAKDGHYKTYYISNNRSYVYFNTYEEAQEAGILKCLTLLLENNE